MIASVYLKIVEKNWWVSARANPHLQKMFCNEGSDCHPLTGIIGNPSLHSFRYCFGLILERFSIFLAKYTFRVFESGRLNIPQS